MHLLALECFLCAPVVLSTLHSLRYILTLDFAYIVQKCLRGKGMQEQLEAR